LFYRIAYSRNPVSGRLKLIGSSDVLAIIQYSFCRFD
jgi:hypothetical protein